MSNQTETSSGSVIVKIQSLNSVTRTFYINRSSFKNLKGFYEQVIPDLIDTVVFKSENQINEDKSQYLIERKSKKSNGYKKLCSLPDFKSMLRSLEVKNKIKLRLLLNRSSQPTDQSISQKLDTILQSLEELSHSRKNKHHSCRNSKEELSHAEITLKTPFEILGMDHFGIVCDQCVTNSNINGVRFKCLDCLDYDLCEICFNKRIFTKDHTEFHRMVAISPVLNSYYYKSPSIQDGIVDGNDSLVDIVFDDFEQRAEIISLIKEFNTLDKLQKLKAIWRAHGENASNIESKNLKKSVNSLSDYISVLFEVFRSDKTYLKCKLINHSSKSLPSNLSLHFIYQNHLLKFSNSLGPEQIPSNGVRKVTDVVLSDNLSKQLFGDIDPCFTVQVRGPSGNVLAAGETIVDSFHLNEAKLFEDSSTSSMTNFVPSLEISTSSKSEQLTDEPPKPQESSTSKTPCLNQQANYNEEMLLMTDDLDEYHILSTDECLTD